MIDNSRVKRNPVGEAFADFTTRQLYESLVDDITDADIQLEFRDRHGLSELASISKMMQDCQIHIREHGVMLELTGDKGSTVSKRNPSVDMLDKLRVAQYKLLREYGMTPNSRPKVQRTDVPNKPEENAGTDNDAGFNVDDI